MQSNHYDLKR